MTNKEKAKIWAKVAKEIQQKGPSALSSCGLCSMGLVNGLDVNDTYGDDDFDGKPVSGVTFMMGNDGDDHGYIWPQTLEGAEQRVIAAQLMACYLNDEPENKGFPD